MLLQKAFSWHMEEDAVHSSTSIIKKQKQKKTAIIIISRGAFKEKSAGAGSTNCMLATTKTRAEVRHNI